MRAHAFILIKLEPAGGQIVLAIVWSAASMLSPINAKRNKYKEASHLSKRLTFCKVLSIPDSKVSYLSL